MRKYERRKPAKTRKLITLMLDKLKILLRSSEIFASTTRL
jgi:hypothetical protein